MAFRFPLSIDAGWVDYIAQATPAASQARARCDALLAASSSATFCGRRTFEPFPTANEDNDCIAMKQARPSGVICDAGTGAAICKMALSRVHFGGCSPGEATQSSSCEAISA